MWDCKGEGATKGEYHIIAGRINDIAWDGDSQRIIAVGDGKERFGHCITADSGNTVGEISGHSSQVNCVSIRQQRPLRAATGSDDTNIVFYHGAPFKFNTSIQGKHNRFVYGTAFSPDGSTLVSVGADKRIWLYDGKTGEPRAQIGEGEHTGSIFGVSWAKDSKNFVTASADRTVKIWDAEAGKVTQTWRLGEEGVVSVPNQQMGVVWPHGRSDNLVISVDLNGNLNYLVPGSSKPSKVVYGHQRNITSAAISGSEKEATLWTGSTEGRVRGWIIASGEASQVDGEGHTNYVSAVATTETSQHVYTAGWDDTLRTIDSSSRTFTGTGPIKTAGQPRDLSASTDGVLAIATLSAVELYIDGKRISDVPMNGYSPTCIAINKSQLVIGGDNKTIHIFSLGTSCSPTESKVISEGMNSSPLSMAFSPDSAHLAVGTAGGPIIVFQTSDWSIATSRWSSHTSRVTCIAWSPDGKFAASGSLDTNVHVWSLASPGKRVKMGNAHKDGVNGIAWIDNGRIISAGADAAVKTWKVSGLQ